MLAAAEASLKALNKGDITEVKAMKRPPVGVVLVIESICIVKNVKPNKVNFNKIIIHNKQYEQRSLYIVKVASCVLDLIRSLQLYKLLCEFV